MEITSHHPIAQSGGDSVFLETAGSNLERPEWAFADEQVAQETGASQRQKPTVTFCLPTL
jgi:hypothetical protein